MKKISLLTVIIFLLFPWHAKAQGFVQYKTISVTDINLRDSLHVLARIDAFIPVGGDVIIRFTGECYPDVGDRIILAANNGPFWLVSYGNVGVQSTQSQIGKSFSHTRIASYYENDIGMHSFYAVGQNWADLNGSGFASVYGTLTIEFIPYNVNEFLAQEGYNFSGDVTSTQVAASKIVFATSAGKVIAHIDGWGHTDVGDRIIYAVSNTLNWLPDDGNVSVEAADATYNINTYAHSRMYDVPSAGQYTYNALVQRSIETDGSGFVDMYGTLTAAFYANSGPVQVRSIGFSKPSLNLNDQFVTLASLSINAPGPGVVLVELDGDLTSDPGDWVELGASNSLGLPTNDGNVTLQAISSDLNRNCFTHSRVYTVDAGQHTFYALGKTFSAQPGSGIANIYGELTVKYFPDQNTAVTPVTTSQNAYKVYPDPTQGMITISSDDEIKSNEEVRIMDMNGRVKTILHGSGTTEITVDMTSWPAGIYFVKIGNGVKKVVKE